MPTTQQPRTPSDVASLSIAEASALLRSGRISALDLTRDALERAARLNPATRWFITLDAEGALAQAQRAEIEIRRGEHRGPLHGIPISLKDNIDTEGLRTTAGSAILKDRVPAADSFVAARLRECGAILIGKTNLHEFAYGITSVNPHFGTVANPWRPGHIAGGSSGGSAASLAAGIGFASVGTDTGGSIRIPASFCGVAGLKPGFDRISVAGTIPLAKSFDHVGPLARRIADVAYLFDALTSRRGVFDEGQGSLEGVRIGWPVSFYLDLISDSVRKLLEDAASCLAALGAELHEVKLEQLDEAVQAATNVQLTEAAAWHRSRGYFPALAEQYGEDVRRLLEMGNSVSAASLAGVPALKQRVRASFDEAFQSVDALLTPATPSAAPQIGATELSFGDRREALRPAIMRLQRPTNFTGHPSLAVPCGFTPERLPVGLQLIGPHDSELHLLRIAHCYEQANTWRRLAEDTV